MSREAPLSTVSFGDHDVRGLSSIDGLRGYECRSCGLFHEDPVAFDGAACRIR